MENSVKTKKKISTKVLVRASFLTAISIVLTRFLSIMVPIAGLPTIRVGFGGIPIAMAGLLFGPLVGGITGLASDLIGVLINPQGAFHPGFTLSAILGGFIPGLFTLYFKKNKKNGKDFTLARIFIVKLFTTIIISIGLNTFWLTQLLGRGYLVLLPARLINALINLPIQAFILFTVISFLDKVGLCE